MPTETTFGRNPCWRAWVRKVFMSGGITTPVMISVPSRLKAAMCEAKVW